MKGLNMALRIFFSILVTFPLFGCSSTPSRVIARDDGTYFIENSGYSDAGARDKALDDAQEYCKSLGKHFYMVTQNKQKQGAGSGTRAVAGVAGSAAGYATNKATRGIIGGGSTQSAVNNSADAFGGTNYELHFKCK